MNQTLPTPTLKPSDICLILEGTYPYVPGGVSTWTHDMLLSQSETTFHIIAILPPGEVPEMVYELPENVTGITPLPLMDLPRMAGRSQTEAHIFESLRGSLDALTTGKSDLATLEHIITTLKKRSHRGDAFALLDSEAAFELICTMYEMSFSESSFLDYFWSWRAIFGGLYTLLMAELPVSKVYHAVSTGYAGVLAARAKLETGRPVILTEHGIYTNERRIEINSADWLEETISKTLSIDPTRRSLREMWLDTFTNYSRICYDACDSIITLFRGNQFAQMADGADPARMHIIPNGIDVARYSNIGRRDHDRPTVALIGRVVPIKDIKTFIQAADTLRQQIPDVRVLIMGPADEDRTYAEECWAMVDYLGLNDTVEFTGKVKIDDWLPEIDILVLSSISEAQPLVILEAGASGIPCVATDVGACSELLLGSNRESPPIGEGGVVVPLANPLALARGILKLITDREFYTSCSANIRERVAQYYDKRDQHDAYRELYQHLMGQ